MSKHTQQTRRSIRLKEYDYSLEGAYFVTLLSYQHLHSFGEIVFGKIDLSTLGKIAFDQWLLLTKRFPNTDCTKFVVMPNHVHGIIYIHSNVGEEYRYESDQKSIEQLNYQYRSSCLSLGTIIRAYKASVSFRFNALRGFTKPPVWQRNYYEQIIRNDRDYENIWKYIDANIETWNEDKYQSKAILDAN
jgi:REP-associated tyrosine transposase